MFKHLFASMNEMLDEVMSEYPSSTAVKRKHLKEKLRALKAMSDSCIEEWLLFEEKLGQMMQATGMVSLLDSADPLDPEFAAKRSDLFVRGQGFYKLHMYSEAIDQFAELLHNQPDFTLARIYLAMSYFHQGHTEDSYSHFQFFVAVNGKPEAESHLVKRDGVYSGEAEQSGKKLASCSI